MNDQFTTREKIIEVVNKLFVYTDNQAWLKLQEEVFTPTLQLDMTSMGAEKVEQVTSREVCYRWEDNFQNLDAIHHQAGNYIVEINGDEANVHAYSIATHFRKSARKGKTREFVGSYELHLVRNHGDWRINGFKYTLKYSTGNMSLL